MAKDLCANCGVPLKDGFCASHGQMMKPSTKKDSETTTTEAKTATTES